MEGRASLGYGMVSVCVCVCNKASNGFLQGSLLFSADSLDQAVKEEEQFF